VSGEEEATLAVASEKFGLANAYLELHLLLADGGDRWLSFSQQTMTLGEFCPEGSGWSALAGEQTVCFQATEQAQPEIWQGQSVRQATLSPGSGRIQLDQPYRSRISVDFAAGVEHQRIRPGLIGVDVGRHAIVWSQR